MAGSFFEQLKPTVSDSWMGALQNQRQLDMENAKLGADMMRTGTPQEQALGQQLVQKAGLNTTSLAPATEFRNAPNYQHIQVPMAQQGPVAQMGQAGGNEAAYYQDQGASSFNNTLKQAGINVVDPTKQKATSKDLIQDPATGDYLKYNPQSGKFDLNANQDVAQVFGGLGLAQPTGPISQADAMRQSSAELGQGAPVQTYQDAIAKQMGIQRGTQGMEQTIQKTMSDRDLQSAQAIADKRAQQEFSKQPLMQRIRSHAFSSTSSPAVAFGTGMDTIDKLEEQGTLSPSAAQEMRDNYVMSFNDETFTGTKGAGTGHYYQEKLKRKQRGTGPGSTESVEIFNAAGDLKTRRLAVPKAYAGNVHDYANTQPQEFIRQYSNTFDIPPDEQKDMIAWVQGSGQYKGQGPKRITAYPSIAKNLELTGKSSSGAIPIGATAEENKRYAESVKSGKSPEEAKAEVWGGTTFKKPAGFENLK